MKGHGLWNQTMWTQILALLLESSYLSSLELNVVIFKNEYNNNSYVLGYYKDNIRKYM